MGGEFKQPRAATLRLFFERRHNAGTLFSVAQIPCDNQMQNLLEPIPPGALDGVFLVVFEHEAFGVSSSNVVHWRVSLYIGIHSI
jgi:hypothetical protein